MATGGLFVFVYVIPLMTSGRIPPNAVTVKLLVSVTLIGTLVLSYAAWPRRWNIVGRSQLAFGLVACTLPFSALDIGGAAVPAVWRPYARLVVEGSPLSAIGAVAGDRPARRRSTLAARLAVRVESANRGGWVRGRLAWIMQWCVARVARRLAVMGFVPAFATGPYSAESVRGAYGAEYKPFGPRCRATASAITSAPKFVGAHSGRTAHLVSATMSRRATDCIAGGRLHDLDTRC